MVLSRVLNNLADARLPFWAAALLLTTAAFSLADEPEETAPTDPRREAYREDAEKCRFSRADGQSLHFVKEPIMRWSNEAVYSGDVFAWTHQGRPEVIGCILSGPGKNIWHEFHLVAEEPIAPADIQNGRRWEPAEGLIRDPVPDVPQPAKRASARLAQMREIARDFHAYMWAGSNKTELRLLPQPLMRYGDEASEVIDGALFAYVWTIGTDPEFILLVECRRSDHDPAWCFAPIRFTNRSLRLNRREKDVWEVQGHKEPAGKLATQIYTTGFARSMPKSSSKPQQ